MNKENRKLPRYEAPEVITYTDDEILEELGPARVCGYHEWTGRPWWWSWWSW